MRPAHAKLIGELSFLWQSAYRVAWPSVIVGEQEATELFLEDTLSDNQLDFLRTRGARAVKLEVQSIVDSYHHYWDPLAELLQNSRDAIYRSRAKNPSKKHFVRILLDANSRRIEVMDNGVGIPEATISELLGPGGGDKWEFGGEVGEKGVGLTYSIFSADEFIIESRNEGEHHGGRVSKARSWREGADHTAEPPTYDRMHYSDLTEAGSQIKIGEDEYELETFTKISVTGLGVPDEDYDLFALTADQIRSLLSTRTAVGVTDRLYDDSDSWEEPFSVYIDVNHPSGGTGGVSQMEAGFEPPHEFVEESKDILELQKAVLQLTRIRDEPKKHKLLHGKTMPLLHF